VSMNSYKRPVLLLVGVAGFAAALLAGLAEYVPFLQSLCTSVSEGCKQTAEISLLRLPVWVWGIAFYLVVIGSLLLRRDWTGWIVPCAAGVEAALVWILVQLAAPCVFCIANAVAVVLLFALSFRKERAWQTAALVFFFVLVSMVLIPYENGISAFGVEKRGGPKPEIAAKVGDEIITDKRLEVLLGSRLQELKQGIYRMKKEKLEQVTADMILQKAAQEKGVSVDEYLNSVLAGRLSVSEQEIDQYLQANADKLRDFAGTPDDLRNRVRLYLEHQKRRLEALKQAESLGSQYGLEVYLTQPGPPSVSVACQGCPSTGPADAPVTVVEFSDYQCPACRSTHAATEQVRAAFPGKIRWIYCDYPLRSHKEAMLAGEAAHCADEQGQFWPYQSLLFTSETGLGEEALEKFAAQLGLSIEKFKGCLQSGKYKDLIEKNQKEATAAGVERTPSFLINENLIVGGPAFEAFKGLIEGELRKAKP
jgi:protein-disulfide isomerase